MLLDRFCQLEIRITVGMLHMSKKITGCIFFFWNFRMHLFDVNLCCEVRVTWALAIMEYWRMVATGRSIDRRQWSDDLHLNVGHHSLMPRDSKRDLFQDQHEHLSWQPKTRHTALCIHLTLLVVDAIECNGCKCHWPFWRSSKSPFGRERLGFLWLSLFISRSDTVHRSYCESRRESSQTRPK